MSYDERSLELAEHFLGDEPNLNTPENRDDLARTIQNAVEDWLEAKQGNA